MRNQPRVNVRDTQRRGTASSGRRPRGRLPGQDQHQDDDGHEASDGRGRAGETARADVIADAVGSSLGDAIEVAAMGARVVVFGMNQNAVIPIRQAVITDRAL